MPAQILSAAFSGCFASLINQNFVHDSINFIEWVNLNEHAAATYVEHFVYINPWADIWTQMRSGSVFVAERHRPARTFTDTQFYIIGAIERAVDFSRDLVMAHDLLASKAAITDRSWPSLVVDTSLKLCSAKAEDRLQGPRFASTHRGSVTALANSPASPASTLSRGGQHGPTVYSLSRLPAAKSFPRAFISGRRQVLIMIKRLIPPPLSPDLTALTELYGHTGVEARLCLSLYEGRNLQETAAELGIGYGTVRTRLKSIFAKTSTRSQPKLCALLAQYAG